MSNLVPQNSGQLRLRINLPQCSFGNEYVSAGNGVRVDFRAGEDCEVPRQVRPRAECCHGIADQRDIGLKPVVPGQRIRGQDTCRNDAADFDLSSSVNSREIARRRRRLF